MKRLILAAATTAAFCTAAAAADAPYMRRTAVYPAPQPILTQGEELDYRRDQLEKRQEMERRALEHRQRAERRMLDPDDDD